MKDSWEEYIFKNILKEPIRDFGSFSLTNLISFQDSGIPFLKSESIQNGYIDFSKVSYISQSVHKILQKSIVRKGDLLYTKIGAICRGAIYDGRLGVCNSNAATAKINTDSNIVDNYFILYLLLSEGIKREFEKSIISTPPRINLGDINNLKINLPPLPQQRKIAQILSTVDAVLEKTEAAIAKYQQLKQGLMHDVFTRGIDLHTGQLRPKQTEAPELYKQSPLGWIPKEWEVETVDSVAFLRHGYQFRDYDFVKEGIDVVKIGQIGKKGNVNLENSSKIASSRLDEFNSIQLFEGDILMALTGATLGKTAIIRNINKPMLQNYRVGYFTPRDENKLNKLFLYYLLIGDSVQNEILGFVNTGAQGNIGKADFEKIKVIVPNSIQEQKLSSLKLQSIDQKIHTEQQALAKYQQLKAGLLQDLLTGRVEVRV